MAKEEEETIDSVIYDRIKNNVPIEFRPEKRSFLNVLGFGKEPEKVSPRDIEFGMTFKIEGKLPYNRATRWEDFGNPLAAFFHDYYLDHVVEYNADTIKGKNYLKMFNIILYKPKLYVPNKHVAREFLKAYVAVKTQLVHDFFKKFKGVNCVLVNVFYAAAQDEEIKNWKETFKNVKEGRHLYGMK